MSRDQAEPPQTTYGGPRTTNENRRLRKQHHFAKRALSNQLVHAPLDLAAPNLRILDAGTADGYWLLDLLPQLHPTAQCIGVDIAPEQFPAPAELPSNIRLSVQSIREPWPAEWKGTFDLVHERAVLSSVPDADVDSVIGAFAELARPGAWVQLVDGNVRDWGQDDSQPDSALAQFASFFAKLFEKFGMRTTPGLGMADVLRRVGLEDVQETSAEVPIGAAAKGKDEEMGELGVEEIMGILDAFKDVLDKMPESAMQFRDGTTFTRAMLDELAPRLEQHLRSTGAKQCWYAAWGRKPL